ncbi:unnamed protein product [Closterium sp. NIES-65]|nr:unnamed protein product [Closterium sp. NIES-65]
MPLLRVMMPPAFLSFSPPETPPLLNMLTLSPCPSTSSALCLKCIFSLFLLRFPCPFLVLLCPKRLLLILPSLPSRCSLIISPLTTSQAHEILDEARFTLYSVYEALGITLGRLVGVDQFGVQLEGLREQLEAARGELAAHKNLITRQAQELAAARGEVAEQSSRMLKVGALEEALVSLTRGDWGSTHTLNVMEHVKHLTAFQKLDMMGCRVADGGVQRLSNLPSLTHIMTDQRSLQ